MKARTMLFIILIAAGLAMTCYPLAGDLGQQSKEQRVTAVRANATPWQNTTSPLADFSLPEDFGEDDIHINLKQAFQDDDTVNNLTFSYTDTTSSSGILVFDISNTAGTVTLHSSANWHGTETITFTARDSGQNKIKGDVDDLIGSLDVSITAWSVNDPPTRTSIAFYSLIIDEGGVASWQDPDYAFLDLSLEFVDNADQDTLVYGRTYSKSQPNVTTEFNPNIGQVTISTMNDDWFGTEMITFWAKDIGNDTNPGTPDDAYVTAPLYITYTEINDEIIFNATPDFVCYEDTWFNYTLDATDPADPTDKTTFGTNIQSIIPSLSTSRKNYAFETKTGKVSILPDNENVGVYKGVYFQAVDGRGSVPKHNISITFVNTNDLPIARIVNLPQEGYYNTSIFITFNGSESEDIDVKNGDVLTYVWTSNITGKIGEGMVLDASLPQPGLHTIWLNITDLAGKTSSVNTTIKVVKERAWGEEMLELSGTSEQWTDIDNNDVFWYNATTDGVAMRKGDTDTSYDLTDLSYKIVGNRIEITLEAKGNILDSSDIPDIEMNYYIYFVKPEHQEAPVNVNVTSSRPRMYEPNSLNSYGWVGLIDGKVKWSDNIYSSMVAVDKSISGHELVLSMFVSDFERIGGRTDFKLFATAVGVVSKIATVSSVGMVWTFYDSVGDGSVKAPDKWGNLVFKNPDKKDDEAIPIGTIVFAGIIVLAILIILFIVILVIRSVAKPVDQPTYDYSKLRQKDEDYTDFESGADNRYQTQNLYGSTGSRAPVGAVAYQTTPGQTHSTQNMMTGPTQAPGQQQSGQQPMGPPPQAQMVQQPMGPPPQTYMMQQPQAPMQPQQAQPGQTPPMQPGQHGM